MLAKASVFSGIAYSDPAFSGLSVRSAIDIRYTLGSPPFVEAFEALPIPRVPVEEALKISLRLYSGEPAVIVTPADYEFRKPLVEQAEYVVLDGRRVDRDSSHRIKYIPEYAKRKYTAFIGVPEGLAEAVLLSGADLVISDGPKRISEESHAELRKRFVLSAEDDPRALRFLRLGRDHAYHGETIRGSLTAYERPEITRRLEALGSYEPPEGDVLIFLPCAYRKPYSLSRTHRPIIEVTKRYRVHELIVTSPLMLVPRERETIFPAVRYDHPPTGKRTPAEKGAIAEALRTLLRKYESAGYKAFVAFLPEDYREALELVDRPIEYYRGKSLDVSRLKSKLRELAASGDLREGSRDRAGMARNALRLLYNAEPPDGVERYLDRIAVGGKTFGTRKDGVLKPRLPMLERLYESGIYVEAPGLRLSDVREASGEAYAGLYVPRKRKQLRSARLRFHMRAIRKLAGIAEGIYASGRGEDRMMMLAPH